MKKFIEKILSENSNSSQFYKNFKIEENKDNSISVFCRNLLIFKVSILKNSYDTTSKIKIDFESKYNEKTKTYKYKSSQTELVEIIEKIMKAADEYIINNYSPETFGCCHRFLECSDSKKCIDPDVLYSKGCQYRKNLESGRIFYGKNRNI